MNWQRIIRDALDVLAIACGIAVIVFLFACTFPSEGTGIADASSSSGDDGSQSSQSSTTVHGTTTPATSSSSAGEGSGSAGATTNEGDATSNSESSDGSESSDSGDPSTSSSGDASSSSGSDELEPYGPCGPDCDAAGMLCLWVSGPGCSSRWCGVCSPACDSDLECGGGNCETQCVLPCDGGCPDGMDCVTAGAPFGVSCMWPEAA
jgi:hypothetical protein